MIPFWYSWPSLLTEVLGGLTLAGFMYIFLFEHRKLWEQLTICTSLSLFYEYFLDKNGWDLGDASQREIGIVIGCFIIWYFFTRKRG